MANDAVDELQLSESLLTCSVNKIDKVLVTTLEGKNGMTSLQTTDGEPTSSLFRRFRQSFLERESMANRM